MLAVRSASWEARLVDARRSGDPSERAARIEEFMPLAQALAWRFHRSNDAHEDLVQVACLGLVKAVDRFGEPAKRMRVSPEEILDARQAAKSQFDHSLDAPAHECSRESLAESLGAEDWELARADRGTVLEGWLAELPDREREILRLRVEEDLTQSEIARQFGISQMHVSRLLRRSIGYLQQRAVEDEGRGARVA